MKNLIATLAPVIANLMATNGQKRSESSESVSIIKNSTDRPHQKNGQMPIGSARFGDDESPNGILSFWQQKALRDNNFQL